MFASRSAMLSESSAKPGSSASIGVAAELSDPWGRERLPRSDPRDGGRSGVVGREGGFLVWEEGRRVCCDADCGVVEAML